MKQIGNGFCFAFFLKKKSYCLFTRSGSVLLHRLVSRTWPSHVPEFGHPFHFGMAPGREFLEALRPQATTSQPHGSTASPRDRTDA